MTLSSTGCVINLKDGRISLFFSAYSLSTHTVSYANAESHYVTVLIMLMKQRAAYASRRVGQAMTQLTVT